MPNVTQIAFQLDNESLRELDRLVASEFSSRADAVRTAVHQLLRQRRAAAIDEQLAAGYAAVPPGREEAAWAELSVESLGAADLDW